MWRAHSFIPWCFLLVLLASFTVYPATAAKQGGTIDGTYIGSMMVSIHDCTDPLDDNGFAFTGSVTLTVISGSAFSGLGNFETDLNGSTGILELFVAGTVAELNSLSGTFTYNFTIPDVSLDPLSTGIGQFAGTVAGGILRLSIAGVDTDTDDGICSVGAIFKGQTDGPASSFFETWTTTVPFAFEPEDVFAGDEGGWLVQDTITSDPNCGPSPHRAEVTLSDGEKTLLLTSVDSGTTCSDNVWVINAGHQLPLTSSTRLSFVSSAKLTNPVAGPTSCLFLPCGDTAALVIQDNHGNILAYILDRAPDAIPNTSHAHYREIFLDSDLTVHSRNLFQDFQTVPLFTPVDAEMFAVVLQVQEHGNLMIDNIAIGDEPVATFVGMTIHGQVPSAFIIGAPVSAPAWISEFHNQVEGLVQQINAARSGMGQIEYRPIVGDWAARTSPGAPSILASRLLYMKTLPPWLFASRFEDFGQDQTKIESAHAAAEFMFTLREVLNQIRELSPTRPIFLDIVCHSRGGAVASTVLRLLSQEPSLPSNVSVSITYLDAIDPGQGEVPRPFALAGELLGDPLVDDIGNERITSLISEFPIIADDLPDPVKLFYGGRLVNSLIDFGQILNPFDISIVNLGYPQGSVRNDFCTTDDCQRVVPGTSHISIVGTFTDLSSQTVPDKSPDEDSFVSTSFIGEMIQNPMTLPPVQEWPGPLPALARIGVVSELVSDSDFSISCDIITESETLLNDADFVSQFQNSAIFVIEFLQDIVSQQFIEDGVWQRSSSNVQMDCQGNEAIVTFSGDATLSQDLGAESLDHQALMLVIDVEFLQAAGTLEARLIGPGLSSMVTVDASTVGVGVSHRIVFRGFRGQSESALFDRIEVQADACHVSTVAVRPNMVGDVNGDLIVNVIDLLALLASWGSCVSCPADFDGDGFVNVNDLLALLANWG